MKATRLALVPSVQIDMTATIHLAAVIQISANASLEKSTEKMLLGHFRKKSRFDKKKELTGSHRNLELHNDDL